MRILLLVVFLAAPVLGQPEMMRPLKDWEKQKVYECWNQPQNIWAENRKIAKAIIIGKCIGDLRDRGEILCGDDCVPDPGSRGILRILYEDFGAPLTRKIEKFIW